MAELIPDGRVCFDGSLPRFIVAEAWKPMEGDPLLTTAEVAEMFRVSERTVRRWASDGLLPAARTLGGYMRFRRSMVLNCLAGILPENQEPVVTIIGEGS